MFEAVRSNRIIVQIILGLIVLTFAFFGIESYLGSIGSDNSVATVGETKIGPAEFENALRQQQDRIRQQSGGQIEFSQLNTPAIREAVLEGLVNQRLLALYASDARLTVSASQLREVIGSIDEFKEDGQFSRTRYEQILRSQGLSEAAFEAQLRRDVAFQQVTTALGNSALIAKQSAKTLLALQIEERQVAIAAVAAARFVDDAKVGDQEIEQYYNENSRQFRRPAEVKAAYAVLDRNQFAETIKPAEEDVKAWYEGHQERYRQDEERRARHILVELAADAPAEAVDEAMRKADGILARVRATGGDDFEQIAREESEDPGSADKGGDLGFFARDMMVKPFEDAVFALSVGEISQPVRSDFGVHIIQLVEIRPEKVKPFEEVRGTIESELREQEVQRRFAEAAEMFANIAYEQPDSLQPVADQFNLKIEQTDWIAREGDALAPFDNRKLLDSLFSADSIERKLNTETVDVGDGRLVAARVLEYRPPETRALEAVRGDIESILKRSFARKRAGEKGQASVAALREGKPVELEFADAVKLTRQSGDVAPELLREVFSAESTKLPAYGGASLSNGDFAVFRIDNVLSPEISADDPRLNGLRDQFERLIAERDMRAFLSELRRRYGVEINRAALQAVAS